MVNSLKKNLVDRIREISTRYRAPECLLTDGYYRSQMDIWSAGTTMTCIEFQINSSFRLCYV